MVMGFNVIFMVMGFNLSTITTMAYDKYTKYYEMEQAVYCVGSGINIAVGAFYKDTGWIPSTSDYTFMGGSTFHIDKTWPGPDSITLMARGYYATLAETSIVGLKRGKFSEYAIYSVNENGIYWITGDTCRGPLHTEDQLNVSGNPVFLGKVTTKLGLYKNPSSSKPQFAGYKSGISQALPSSCAEVISLGSSGGQSYSNKNVWIDFYPDGKIAVRTPTSGSTRTIYDNVSSLTSNGVVLVKNGDLHIKGTLNGRITLGCTGTGKVYLDSSIVYATDPKSISPRCDDMLGIVADKDILITDNSNNTNPAVGVTINASLFSRTGGLQAENYASRDVSGKLKVVGGIQQKNRNPVGTFYIGGAIASGFQKDYDFDKRLQTDAPVGYPALQKFTVMSWYERTNFPDSYFE